MMLRLLIVVALGLVVLATARAYVRAKSRPVDVSALPRLPRDIGGRNATWVIFTSEYCATCGPVKERIRELDPMADLVEVDVAERPDLATTYLVRTAPTVLFASANRRIQARFVGNVPATDLETAYD